MVYRTSLHNWSFCIFLLEFYYIDDETITSIYTQITFSNAFMQRKSYDDGFPIYYKIPNKGLYKYISSPYYYLGEILEWLGWADFNYYDQKGAYNKDGF